MIVRATKKLLNASRIDPLRDERPLPDAPPGEWYAHGVSAARRSAVHYLHVPSLLSIVVRGRSINTTSAKVPARLEQLLKRHRFDSLYGFFAVSLPTGQAGTPVVLTTASRKLLGYLNNMRPLIEYHLARPGVDERLDLSRIEDICMDHLFTVNGKAGNYTRPREQLTSWMG